jgi:hypothetical protein
MTDRFDHGGLEPASRYEIRKERDKGKKKKQEAALVSARRGDVTDALERVLTKGVVFEIEEGAVAGSEAGGAGAWFRVSIAGVDVFKIEAGVSWRSWLEAEDEE